MQLDVASGFSLGADVGAIRHVVRTYKAREKTVFVRHEMVGQRDRLMLWLVLPILTDLGGFYRYVSLQRIMASFASRVRPHSFKFMPSAS